MTVGAEAGLEPRGRVFLVVGLVRAAHVRRSGEITIIAARVLEAAVLQSYVQQLFAANMQLLTELASSRIDDTEARTKKYKCECRVYATMLNVMSKVDPDEFIVALTSDVFPICVQKMNRHFQRPGQVHIGQRPEDTERHRLDTSNTFYTSETSDLP